MVQFLSLLTRAIERGNIELAVVFNGTIEQCRMNEWIAEQANIRQRVGMVLKHINTKATPPPKIWWTPPTCLRSALRMALRHLGVTVVCLFFPIFKMVKLCPLSIFFFNLLVSALVEDSVLYRTVYGFFDEKKKSI